MKIMVDIAHSDTSNITNNGDMDGKEECFWGRPGVTLVPILAIRTQITI